MPHHGHFEVVKLLLRAPGIDVNRANKDGRTPLHWASQNGHSELVKLLLAMPGIEIFKRDREGMSAMDVALNPAVASLLECVVDV